MKTVDMAADNPGQWMYYCHVEGHVNAGMTVVWTNHDAVSHTVTADDGSFGGRLAPGGTSIHAFTTAGTFTCHCAFHPLMRGTVIVQ